MDHPDVGADGGCVVTKNRQGDGHRGDSMSALGGSAFGKPLHELAQGWNVELAMLHFVNDEIIVGRGKFQADVIAIAPLLRWRYRWVARPPEAQSLC